MNKLLTLQQEFQAHILGEPSTLSNMIMETYDLSKAQRIALYAEGYVARLAEALTANYPQLQQYIGNEIFDQIARAYIRQHPSTIYSIREFGHKLSDFLQENTNYAKRPVLAELARFEWAVGDTFDSQDSLTLTADDLRSIPPAEWGDLRFHFHSSVRHCFFSYNIIQIWEALLENKIKKPIRLKSAKPVLFWRHNLDTLYRPLSTIESHTLASAQKGEAFAILCENLCQFVPEDQAGLQAATILMQWLSYGLIITIAPN